MSSNINPTYPATGSATTQSVRDNFAAAKTEIEALQAAAGAATGLAVVGGTVVVSNATAPSIGQVLTATGASAASWQDSSAGGTVTDVSVASANGFTGTVATSTTTPAITISTSITGVLKGNGTAISAASAGTDYAPATSGSAILKGDGSGGFSNASGGTDYVAPGATTTSGLTMAPDRLLGRTTATTGAIEEISVAGSLTLSAGVLTGTAAGTVTAVSVASANGFAGSSSGGATPALTLTTSITGLLKGNGTAISAASSGTDYAPATSGSSILKGDGSGGFSNASSGTDYAPATSGTSILKGNGSGGFSNASGGTDYVAPGGALGTPSSGTLTNCDGTAKSVSVVNAIIPTYHSLGVM